MKKNWTILILLLLIVGCEQKTDNRSIDPNVRLVEIDFAKVSVALPKIFQKISPDELIYAIENIDTTGVSEPEQIERIERVGSIERMKLIGNRFDIYVDTTDIYHTIIFYQEKYLRIDKEFLQYYVPGADKKLKSDWGEKGINVRRVDLQFFTEKRVQVLKLKYEMTKDEIIGYSTSYLVTTNSNSFVIVIAGLSDEDYEDQILHMRIAGFNTGR